MVANHAGVVEAGQLLKERRLGDGEEQQPQVGPHHDAKGDRSPAGRGGRRRRAPWAWIEGDGRVVRDGGSRGGGLSGLPACWTGTALHPLAAPQPYGMHGSPQLLLLRTPAGHDDGARVWQRNARSQHCRPGAGCKSRF